MMLADAALSMGMKGSQFKSDVVMSRLSRPTRKMIPSRTKCTPRMRISPVAWKDDRIRATPSREMMFGSSVVLVQKLNERPPLDTVEKMEPKRADRSGDGIEPSVAMAVDGAVSVGMADSAVASSHSPRKDADTFGRKACFSATPK